MSKNLIPVTITIVSATTLAWATVSCSTVSGNSPPPGSSSGSSNGGGDAGDGGFQISCTATATGTSQALIDNQSAPTGTRIAFSPTFMPTICGMVGTWYDYNSGSGATMGTIGPSDSMGRYVFSALPPGLPADAGVPMTDSGATERGAEDSADGGADGSATSAKGACVNGVTGSALYNTSGLGFNFTRVPGTDGGVGGSPIQAPVNASSYTGIQFWVWGAADGGTQSVFLSLADINETQGFGSPGTPTRTGFLCDPANAGATACGATRASVTFGAGWTLEQVAFRSLNPIPGYGSSNESSSMVDPSTLTWLQWQIQQVVDDAGAGVPFNFCIYGLSFY